MLYNALTGPALLLYHKLENYYERRKNDKNMNIDTNFLKYISKSNLTIYKMLDIYWGMRCIPRIHGFFDTQKYVYVIQPKNIVK